MNLFATSTCPIKSAEFLDDKRVTKMCLETAQLLSSALIMNGQPATYKLTHKNHPVSVWCRQTRDNYVWTLEHFKALLNEYKKRYNNVHACSRLIPEFENGIKFIPEGNLQKFVNCAANSTLGISYKGINDTTKAYRLYLEDRWLNDKRTPTWYKVKK